MTSADVELKRRAFLLFKEVVELEAGEREQRLLEACAGNAELRTRVMPFPGVQCCRMKPRHLPKTV